MSDRRPNEAPVPDVRCPRCGYCILPTLGFCTHCDWAPPRRLFEDSQPSVLEVCGWRILLCSDAHRTWVEVEPGSIKLTPGDARDVAAALEKMGAHAGHFAVRRFVRAAQ